MRLLILIFLGWSLTFPAHAYVDPGTGMLAIQSLIALVIGVVAFVKNPIQTVRRWWRRLTGKHDDHA